MKITKEKLKEILEDYEINVDLGDIKDNVNLYDQDIDSIDVMNMLLGIEELGVKISDEDANKLETLNDFLNYINRNLNKGSTNSPKRNET